MDLDSVVDASPLDDLVSIAYRERHAQEVQRGMVATQKALDRSQLGESDAALDKATDNRTATHLDGRPVGVSWGQLRRIVKEKTGTMGDSMFDIDEYVSDGDESQRALRSEGQPHRASALVKRVEALEKALSKIDGIANVFDVSSMPVEDRVDAVEDRTYVLRHYIDAFKASAEDVRAKRAAAKGSRGKETSEEPDKTINMAALMGGLRVQPMPAGCPITFVSCNACFV